MTAGYLQFPFVGSGQLGLKLDSSPTWLYSALLMAVIVGSMRTTRRGLLQVLQVCCGELWGWGKTCVKFPYPVYRALWKRLPSTARRQLRWLQRHTLRMLLGRRAAYRSLAALRLACKGKHHGMKHAGVKKRFNKTVTLYRKMPLKAMSRLWGRFNEIELPVFLRRPLLGLYIWLFGCRLDECEVEDLKQYRNLGEFFRRQLKPGCRPINDDHVLCSPADGKILYYGKVKNGVLEQVKGVTYSLRGFLGPQTWQVAETIDFDQISDEVYQKQLGLQPDHDLFHCIIYLAPGDYHRFHSPTHWSVAYRRHFPGELLSVNPGVARWIQGLFNFNERAVYMGKWDHGFFSMCAVGATNVGSIKIYCDEELETNTRKKHREGTFFDKSFTDIVEVDKGEMFGEFNLGSTLVLIFEAPSDFEFKIQEGQKICYGEPIGKSP